MVAGTLHLTEHLGCPQRSTVSCCVQGLGWVGRLWTSGWQPCAACGACCPGCTWRATAAASCTPSSGACPSCRVRSRAPLGPALLVVGQAGSALTTQAPLQNVCSPAVQPPGSSGVLVHAHPLLWQCCITFAFSPPRRLRRELAWLGSSGLRLQILKFDVPRKRAACSVCLQGAGWACGGAACPCVGHHCSACTGSWTRLCPVCPDSAQGEGTVVWTDRQCTVGMGCLRLMSDTSLHP